METRLPILLSEGVNKGRITLERFVALTSTNPAKLYGLYPRQGALVIGADADVTLWDADHETVISQANLHHGANYTPYEGMAIKGWPVRTVLRGQTVALNGDIVALKGIGTYRTRGTSGAFA